MSIKTEQLESNHFEEPAGSASSFRRDALQFVGIAFVDATIAAGREIRNQVSENMSIIEEGGKIARIRESLRMLDLQSVARQALRGAADGARIEAQIIFRKEKTL